MGKFLFKFLVISALIGAIIIAVTSMRKNPGGKGDAALPIFASETPVPSSATEVSSPDGKVAITMREKKVEAGILHTFSISGTEIFSKTFPQDSSLAIPFNAFSPDNKYILLKETNTDGTSFFVVGLAGGEIYDLSGLFADKFSDDFKIADATGWGGVNLVVFNTRKIDGSGGPSFWFEVPSKAFIRLSHSF